jgi:adenine phosphoribosyltransferase
VSIEQIKACIRDVPDFPKPGILFKDITPLLAEPQAFRFVIEQMAGGLGDLRADAIVAIESRGFLLGSVLAARLGLPLQIVRKPGKLPWKTAEVSYALEYGTDRLQIHADAVRTGGRYAIVDDVLATGGTAVAATELVRRLGGQVVGCSFLIELGFLGGRERLGDLRVESLLQY